MYYYISDIDLTEKFEKLPHYPHPPYKFFDPQLLRQVGEFMYPAFPEYVARWMYPFPFRHSNGDWMKNITDWWLDRLLPAHCLNESHGDEWFDRIADAFNNANTPGEKKPLGIVFNVFEPGTGTEYLHVNKTAYDVLVNKRKGGGREEEDKVHKVKIEEPPITGDAVHNALRFWLYGFERPMVPWSYWFGTRPPLSCIDGGYHRQIILRELHDYDSIYTVRPENESWMGELPRNMLELTDLLVELWFNSSYAGDVAGLELINKLIDNHELGDGYKHVEIIPVVAYPVVPG